VSDANEAPKTFAEKLQHLRRLAGLTKTELFKRSGISVASLSRFESADPAQRRVPSAGMLRVLAASLGVDAGALETPDVLAGLGFRGRLARLATHSGWRPSRVAETAIIHGAPKVGKGTSIGHFVVLDALHGDIDVGTDCEIGNGVQILTRVVQQNGNVLTGPVKCGNNVTIGSNAVLLPGAELDDGEIVLPGTIYGGL
jgi:transcriptional regulator with XRE-family HTH domain